MGLGKTIKNIWSAIRSFVKSIYDCADNLAEKLCPVAIGIVDGIKTINSSTVGDILELILCKLIPGTVDDKVIGAVRKWLTENLPRIATELRIIDSIANIEDINEQLKAICNAINISSDKTKNAVYHTLAHMIIEDLSDGKISWSEAVILAEYYYSHKTEF